MNVLKIILMTILKSGYVIGLVFVVPLIIWVLNTFVFQGREVSEQTLKCYMDDARVIEVFVPNPTERWAYRIKAYTHQLRRNGSGARDYRSITFFSAEHQKYLSVLTFDGFDYGEDGWDRNDDRVRSLGNYMHVRINNAQDANPHYGSRDNPLPIFAMEITRLGNENASKAALAQEKRYFDMSEAIQTAFIKTYLQYLMPEEEFLALEGQG